MIPTQPNKYLEASIQNATSAQLLIMTYDGAIRFCKQAIESLKDQDHDHAHQFISKTQDIINEFMITLDRNAPVAQDLLRLYEYFQSKLIEANVKKSPEPAVEVLNFLVDLKETWLQAAKLSHVTKTSSEPAVTFTAQSASVPMLAPASSAPIFVPAATAPVVSAPTPSAAPTAPAASAVPAPNPMSNTRPAAAYGQQANPYRKAMSQAQTMPNGR
jgi:flagellar protein FliS